MKEGDIVIYVGGSEHENLTYGKSYTVIAGSSRYSSMTIGNTWYQIMVNNDLGILQIYNSKWTFMKNKKSFEKDTFILLSEWRERKLNELLK